MTIGVYQIKNLKTGDYYIGRSVDCESRWWGHGYDLDRRIHSNPRLQEAWDRDGRSSFEFRVIATCDRKWLSGLERGYIEKYRPYYNIKARDFWPGLQKIDIDPDNPPRYTDVKILVSIVSNRLRLASRQ